VALLAVWAFSIREKHDLGGEEGRTLNFKVHPSVSSVFSLPSVVNHVGTFHTSPMIKCSIEILQLSTPENGSLEFRVWRLKFEI
jgi:hypothetical protein